MNAAVDDLPAPDGEAAAAATASPREVVIVTGISGSGKSVALHALEDAGFFCVDNLPPELLRPFLQLEHQRDERRVAIAVDSRSAGSLPKLLPLLEELRGEGVRIRSVFLDSSTDALVRRFSETRRPHPLTQHAATRHAPEEAAALGLGAGTLANAGAGPEAGTVQPRGRPSQRALIEAIEVERELLSELREVSTVIDTSQLRPAQLREWMIELVQVGGSRLALVFESFAFKHGVPMDADFVFDVRVVPNPYYVRELRPLTGRDEPVVLYLESQPEALDMLLQIEQFLARWLPAFEEDLRSYLTVAIGCTGGQHRSVYFAEMLARRFGARGSTLVRHRELDAKE